MPTHRLLSELTYRRGKKGVEKTVAPGTVVDDLPADSIPWLIEQGHVVEVEETEPEATPDTTDSPPEA